MYLEELYTALGVTDRFDKIVLAAIVLSTYHANVCGVTWDNHTEVRDILIEGLCTPYEFDMLYLATEWTNDMTDLLCEHIKFDKRARIFKDYIWPFMRSHEPIPGVRMRE